MIEKLSNNMKSAQWPSRIWPRNSAAQSSASSPDQREARHASRVVCHFGIEIDRALKSRALKFKSVWHRIPRNYVSRKKVANYHQYQGGAGAAWCRAYRPDYSMSGGAHRTTKMMMTTVKRERGEIIESGRPRRSK